MELDPTPILTCAVAIVARLAALPSGYFSAKHEGNSGIGNADKRRGLDS